MNRSHAQSGGWFRFDFLSGRSPLPTFWLFIVVGLMMSFGFGVTAIWRASQAPLDSARDDFVVMQNRLIEDWIDYQIAGYISGLRYLASKPLVISTVVGESQSNHALDDLISQFDLLPSLTHIEIIDVLGERLATRSVDPAWYGVYTGLELLDTASSQLETPDVIVGTRLSFENNTLPGWQTKVESVFQDTNGRGLTTTLVYEVSAGDPQLSVITTMNVVLVSGNAFGIAEFGLSKPFCGYQK